MRSSQYPDLSKSNKRKNEYPDLSIPDMGNTNAVQEILKDLPESKKEDLLSHIIPEEGRTGLRKAAGYALMLGLPEAEWLRALTPARLYERLPAPEGIPKLITDYLSSIGKVGASSVLGSEVAGASHPESLLGGAIGSGLTAVTTPLAMATSSLNPFVRLGAGAGLGALLGAGINQMTDIPYTSAIGSVLGGLAGLGGRGVSQMAARDVAENLSPEQVQLAREREAASQQLNVPLTFAEKTGNPIIAAMQQNAASSGAGSRVLHPFAEQRERQMQGALGNLMQDISPEYRNAGNVDIPFSASNVMVPSAYRRAFDIAEQQGTQVNVNPVVRMIDQRLPQYNEYSSTHKALTNARNNLLMTEATRARHNQIMEGQGLGIIDNNIANINQQNQQLINQLAELRSNAPEPYFRESSGYNKQLTDLENRIENNRSLMQYLHDSRESIVGDNLQEFENTVRGLDNAKKSISGIIDAKGSSAPDQTTKVELKQINTRLTNEIKDASQHYAAATRLANLSDARQSIEAAMAESNMTGSNFYDKYLGNQRNYDRLYERLRDPNHPDVMTSPQRTLEAMRVAFPDLIENVIPKSSKAIAQAHEGGFDVTKLMKTFMNSIYMNRYNRAIAEIMIDPRLQQQVIDIRNLPAGEDRGIALGRLLSKVATTGGIGLYRSNQQGS